MISTSNLTSKCIHHRHPYVRFRGQSLRTPFFTSDWNSFIIHCLFSHSAFPSAVYMYLLIGLKRGIIMQSFTLEINSARWSRHIHHTSYSPALPLFPFNHHLSVQRLVCRMEALLKFLADRGKEDNDVQSLESLDLPGIAEFIKGRSCRNIFVMVRKPF